MPLWGGEGVLVTIAQFTDGGFIGCGGGDSRVGVAVAELALAELAFIIRGDSIDVAVGTDNEKEANGSVDIHFRWVSYGAERRLIGGGDDAMALAL